MDAKSIELFGPEYLYEALMTVGAEKLLATANFDFDGVLGTGAGGDSDSMPNQDSAMKGQSSIFASPHM